MALMAIARHACHRHAEQKAYFDDTYPAFFYLAGHELRSIPACRFLSVILILRLIAVIEAGRAIKHLQ